MNRPDEQQPGAARPDDAMRPAADDTAPPNRGDGCRNDVAGSGNSLGDGRSAGGQDSELRQERRER